jgi:hypothetical protein
MKKAQVTFDLMVLTRLLTEDSAFRVVRRIPPNAVIEGFNVIGQTIMFQISYDSFEDDSQPEEYEIVLNEYRSGSGS